MFVTDTGNKRILVFSADGAPITQFGSPGAGEGQLDEPVGLAVDEQGRVYVADAWNRRVQIFAPGPDGFYASVAMWERGRVVRHHVRDQAIPGGGFRAITST